MRAIVTQLICREETGSTSRVIMFGEQKNLEKIIGIEVKLMLLMILEVHLSIAFFTLVDKACLYKLLNLGSDLKAVDYRGSTPLHVGCY